MRLVVRQLFVAAVAFAAVGCFTAGCGGPTAQTLPHIAVSLNPATVVVAQSGAPTHALISIVSPSETALVSLVGLPGGVQVAYAASDTNPSGLLTFEATAHVTAGTYMPIINVNSAGQMASFTFTLIVPAA